MVEVAEAAARTGESLYARRRDDGPPPPRHARRRRHRRRRPVRRRGDGDAARAAGHDVVVVDPPTPRATRCRPTRSPEVAWSGSCAGDCSTRAWSRSPPIRRSSSMPSTGPIVRSVKDRYGVDLLIALVVMCSTRSSRTPPRKPEHVCDRGSRRRRPPRRRRSSVGHGPRRRRTAPQDPPVRGRRRRIARGRPVGQRPVIDSATERGATHYRLRGRRWTLEFHIRRRRPPACSRPTAARPASGCARPAPSPSPARRPQRTATAARCQCAPTRPASPARCRRSTAGEVSDCPTTCGTIGPGWALVGDAGYHRDAVTATASPTRSATPNCSPTRDAVLVGPTTSPTASAPTTTSVTEAPGGLRHHLRMSTFPP